MRGTVELGILGKYDGLFAFFGGRKEMPKVVDEVSLWAKMSLLKSISQKLLTVDNILLICYTVL